MIGIRAIASYIPSARLSNLERMQALDMDEVFIRDKLGILQVSRCDEQENTSDLAAKAVEQLLRKLGKQANEVECLIVCTQNPDGHGIPHTSAIVHGKLGMSERCAAFDIGLGCSGYVYGLSVVMGFMQAAGLRNGILVTADPYSKTVNPADRDTAAIFGDGATATWLEEGASWHVRKCRFGTAGGAREALHNMDGILHMNGRAVFNFVLTRVSADIKALLADSGLSAGDIELFLCHQGSRYMVEQLSMRLGIPNEKTPFEIADYGNTVSSSIPLLLENRLDSSNGPLLLSGFGVGLSWGSCIIEKEKRTT